MFAPWRSHNPVRKTGVSDYWKIIHYKSSYLVLYIDFCSYCPWCCFKNYKCLLTTPKKRTLFEFKWTAKSTNRGQEPITRSQQLPCVRVTVFPRTSIFLEWFWHEFWISFKFHKPVSKTYRLKNDIFCLLLKFSFPFWYLVLRMRSETWEKVP